MCLSGVASSVKHVRWSAGEKVQDTLTLRTIICFDHVQGLWMYVLFHYSFGPFFTFVKR